MSNLDSYLSALTCPLRQEGASGLPGADAPGAFLASEQNPVLLPFEEDRLRITLCAPVRRLQQKTQVFPLDVRTSSRSRLTHSLEVQVYLRHLMQLLCRKTPPLTPYAAALTVLCENAALLHDIGNPPFGHFGECLTAKFTGKAAAERASELSESEREDLSFFNGNAQGLRLVTTIQRLNLTLGQLSAMMKYPQTYAEKVSGRGRGGVGVFLPEAPLLLRIRRERGTEDVNPLAFIMELCDDLAYVLADLEDAFDNRVLSYATFYAFAENLSSKLPSPFKEGLQPSALYAAFALSPSEGMQAVRRVIATAYLEEVASHLSAHLEELLQRGEVDLSGLTAVQVVRAFKDFERHEVYESVHVESLELAGAAYLESLFRHYGVLLEENARDFYRELSGRGGSPYLRRLAHRISRRPREAYLNALRTGVPLSELYLRVRLISDYVSGMTDTYAAHEAGILEGHAPL